MCVVLKVAPPRDDVACEMSYHGFSLMQCDIARIHSNEWGAKYAECYQPLLGTGQPGGLEKYTEKMLSEHRISPVIAEFCMDKAGTGVIKAKEVGIIGQLVKTVVEKNTASAYTKDVDKLLEVFRVAEAEGLDIYWS